MKCECIKTESSSLRQTFRDNNSTPPRVKNAPFMMKVLNTLGLKNTLLNKFVFRPREPRYKIEGERVLSAQGDENARFPYHSLSVRIITQQGCQTTVAHLKSKHPKALLTIIYSHGNSSDLLDSLYFLEMLLKKCQAEQFFVNAVAYDYTGYGASFGEPISEESLVHDLENVLKLIGVCSRSVVLWGFSLGSYPSVQIAGSHTIGGLILHSPLASAACFLDEQAKDQDGHLLYDQDCLDNLEQMGKVNSPIIIVHSSADEIIPFKHAMNIYERIKKEGKCSNYSLIEVQGLSHNQMHPYMVDSKVNPINAPIFNFLKAVERAVVESEEVWERDPPAEGERACLQEAMGENESKKGHGGYFSMS